MCFSICEAYPLGLASRRGLGAIIISLFPTSYFLLPTSYFLLPISYFLFPISYLYGYILPEVIFGFVHQFPP